MKELEGCWTVKKPLVGLQRGQEPADVGMEEWWEWERRGWHCGEGNMCHQRRAQ